MRQYRCPGREARNGNSGPHLNRSEEGQIRMTKVAVRTRALTLSLALCLSYLIEANRLWAAPVTSPMGSYGILLNQWPSSNTGR